MQIKEIEILSGMDRGNIRFYEGEGLITPQRMDNGYRDYSEEDLQILLRIKLLRSLHISLEEIKALKDGNRDLLETLSNQIMSLEQEKQGASYAQDVCRAMQEDGVAFVNLDAKKYLDGINRTMKETGSSYFAVKGDELPQVFNPWRRFLARMLDLFLYDMIWSVFVALVFNVTLANRSSFGRLFDSFITLIMMLLLEPLWLNFWRTTPGKAILGLRIEASDGYSLSYGEGLERTWGVIGAGMGYNIPIFNLFRLWKSYRLCSENETQPWDEAIAYSLKDNRWYRWLFYAGMHAAVIAVLATIISFQQLPPNRGHLTVAEFAENHNYYVKYLDINFGNDYLNEEGKWSRKTSYDTQYIDIGMGFGEKPEYHFTIEDGYVTGISFSVEIKDNAAWITSYDSYMLLASLAYAGAQNEVGLFTNIPKQIAETIGGNTFKDFDYKVGDTTIACDFQYTGYINTASYFLLPDEKAEETYFSLNFSIYK